MRIETHIGARHSVQEVIVPKLRVLPADLKQPEEEDYAEGGHSIDHCVDWEFGAFHIVAVDGADLTENILDLLFREDANLVALFYTRWQE